MALKFFRCVFLATTLFLAAYANDCAYTEVPTSALNPDSQDGITSGEDETLAHPNITILWSMSIAYDESPFRKEYPSDPCGDLRHEIDSKSSMWAPGTAWTKSTCNIKHDYTVWGRSTGKPRMTVNELGTVGLDIDEMTRTLQELLGVSVECRRNTKAQPAAKARLQEIWAWFKETLKCIASGTDNGNAEENGNDQVAAYDIELQNPKQGAQAVRELKTRSVASHAIAIRADRVPAEITPAYATKCSWHSWLIDESLEDACPHCTLKGSSKAQAQNNLIRRSVVKWSFSFEYSASTFEEGPFRACDTLALRLHSHSPVHGRMTCSHGGPISEGTYVMQADWVSTPFKKGLSPLLTMEGIVGGTQTLLSDLIGRPVDCKRNLELQPPELELPATDPSDAQSSEPKPSYSKYLDTAWRWVSSKTGNSDEKDNEKRNEKVQKKSKLRRATGHSTNEFENVDLNEERVPYLDASLPTGSSSCASTGASELVQSECQETKQTTSSRPWSEKMWAWLTSLAPGKSEKNSKENEKGEKQIDYEMQEWNDEWSDHDRYEDEVEPDTGNIVPTIPVPYQA